MLFNPALPSDETLFQPVKDAYGLRVALVFGNEAPLGLCPFYKKQCFHCDIGAGEGYQFNTLQNQTRLDFFRNHYQEVWPEIAHLVVYNSGSVLNQREFSKASLQPILHFAASLPRCKVVSLDSREPYITPASLGFVIEGLRPDQTARIILGLETQSDAVRIGVLQKRMTRPAIERAFRVVAQAGSRAGLDINVLFAPPPLTGEEAVAESIATVSYALELAHRFNVSVDFNLHPYYPSQIGLEEFPHHPRSELRQAFQAIHRICDAIRQHPKPCMLFLGWQDETHDQEQRLREEELLHYQGSMDQFNQTQNSAYLLGD